MDNPNPIKYSDLIQPDNSITQLIAQLDELIAKYESARSRIQGAAADTSKAMNNLAGATEEQRQAILKNAEASEQLYKAYKNIDDELLKAKVEKAELKAIDREQAQVAKLLVEINNSVEGSYKRLSAQYRLNKIALNEMSAEERRSTEYGRKLEKESKAIYEEMNRLQKATGKSQLQVGQYERALGGLLGVNTKYLDVLADSTKRTEAFHGVMNAIKSPIGAAIGVIGALTAAFKLWIDSAHDTQQTGDQLDYAVAGWTGAWERFKKAVATVDFTGFIRGAYDAARAGRELKQVMDETFERTSSTRLLKASMSEENAQLEEAARNTQLSYEERRKAAEQYLANMQPIYDQETETAKRNRDAQLEYLFSVTNQRQFATEQAREAAKQEFADNIKNYNLNEDLIKQAKEYNEARRKITQEGAIGYFGTSYKPAIDAELEIVNGASEAVKQFAVFVEQYNLTNDKQVKAYVDAEEAYLNAQAAVYNDQKRFVTLKNSFVQQENQERQRNAAAAKKAAEDQAKADETAAKAAEDARKKEIADQRAYLQAQLQNIQLQISITEDGTEQILALRIDAINKQREIEIFENNQKAEKLRQDEAAINAKYDKMVLQERADFNHQIAERDLAAAQDLAQAEFDLLDRNERQKTIFRLEQEKARLEAVLQLNETATKKLTQTEIDSIRKTIESIDKEISRTGYKNLYELLGIGLSGDQQDALNTALNSVKDSIGSLVDSWNEAAEAAKKAADAQVDGAQRALEAEIEARNAGYANEVVTAQKELALAQKSQEQAAREQERAQRAQIAADSISQSSSLITASANIWKSLSGIPVVGPGLAVAALATMWASFAASKIRAVQVTRQTEQYGDGTVELLQGGSHASGHDIDLGSKRDGTRRRAEGGEFFAVINKRNSRRFRNVIPDVINSLNDGTFADRYQRANETMGNYAIDLIGAGKTDVSGLERDVAAIRRQGDETRYVDGHGNTIIHYKNLTRKIKS